MKPFLRILIACLIVAAIAGALVWGFLAGRKEQAAEAEREAPIQAASRVTAENGETILSFDQAAQKANGIVTAALAQSRISLEAEGNGVVLQLQPLLDLKTSYNSAQMDIVKSRATARASESEYERLRQLNANGKNASEKAVEAALATADSDDAVMRNAEQSLAILRGSAKLRWGPVVANWLEQGSPQLDALLGQRAVLLQVTTVNAAGSTAPAQATVQMPDGAHASVHLISTLPQVDPRLQAPSFLYTASAHPGLIPGINLPVFLPAGPARNGAIVPYGAVVWWQGRAWCYMEESPGKFIREEVSTANPASTGWFVSQSIAAGARIVIAGAQTLLSEEFRSQIQADQD